MTGQKSIFPPSSLAVVRISSLNYKTRNLSSSIYENRLFLHLGWFRRLFVPRWTADTATTLTPFQRMRPAAERNPRPFPSLLSSLSLSASSLPRYSPLNRNQSSTIAIDVGLGQYELIARILGRRWRRTAVADTLPGRSSRLRASGAVLLRAEGCSLDLMERR